VGSRVHSTVEIASLDLLSLVALRAAAGNERKSRPKMKFAIAILFFVGLVDVSRGQENPPINQAGPLPLGLAIGQPAPGFALTDQFGHEQSSETLKGSKGTVILFFRSADWWPFSKAQLVQLQNAKQKFDTQGLKLTAISYDSPAILKNFAERHKIEFPLLADPNSEIIRRFNVLNGEAKGMTKGMAYPGFFYVDAGGVIREKYFTPKYTDRLTANNVISKLFPELSAEVTQDIKTPHLQLTLAQSDRSVIPGGRVSLIVDIELPPEHVYSPGVQGYKPIQLTLQRLPGIEFQPVAYPNSKVLYLEAIREHVPVFEGKFRISQDLTVTPSKASHGIRAIFSKERTISIVGDLKYQACDQTVCFPPTSVPVKWQLQVLPLDLKRSPKAIQHK
jgi:peroxiredoxin